MELKRILARDSRSANEKAIQLYGPDVLIISSQKLDNQTELIVAVDLDAKPSLEKTVSVAMPQTAEHDLVEETAFVPFAKLFQSASAFVPLDPEEALESPVTKRVTDEPKNRATWTKAENEERDMAKTVLTQTPSQIPQHALHESQRSLEIVEMLRSEMAALRKEFSLSRQMQTWQDGLRLSPPVQVLVDAMGAAAVPAGLRGLLVESIQSLNEPAEALAVMHGLLMNALLRERMEAPLNGVHALCGPSGAGKTAMVARLAYLAAKSQGSDRHVMVSFADQRPGAWSQMQMLASQAGVACYKALDSDMLKALLSDLEGKSVWIDTSGADFLGQAELLSRDHPGVLRHAVLPVDATVTSVQKILHQSRLTWTSLMLSKWDEAANPWALLQGLTENPLPVSCVSDGVGISQGVSVFDVDRLVQLALQPLVSESDMTLPCPVGAATEKANQPAARVRVRKSAVETSPKTAVKAKRVVQPSVSGFSKPDDFLIPTLLAASPEPRSRRRAANTSSALKVVNG